MDEYEEVSREELHAGLKKIRGRRWLLWLLIIAYMPIMLTAMRMENSGQAIVIAFALWVLLLIVVVAMMALVRCPRCGNCYHMSGITFRPVRKCFSCGLPLNADKKK
ncbi:MAG: hypothetical protein C0622_13745 [Desulfuromonas sp.]|nr:MAG: hypothetical protein C0622_13745 [Desulfuromonas sp.]